MAKPKLEYKKSLWESMREANDRIKEASPVVGTRWYVVDFYPSIPYSNEYEDGWTDPRSEVASHYYETEKEAETWASEHDPDKGAELVVHYENLRVFTEERWVNW